MNKMASNSITSTTATPSPHPPLLLTPFELTRRVIHLLAANDASSSDTETNSDGNRVTRTHRLVTATRLMNANPTTPLLIHHYETIQQHTDSQLVARSVLSAAYHACATLEEPQVNKTGTTAAAAAMITKTTAKVRKGLFKLTSEIKSKTSASSPSSLSTDLDDNTELQQMRTREGQIITKKKLWKAIKEHCLYSKQQQQQRDAASAKGDLSANINKIPRNTALQMSVLPSARSSCGPTPTALIELYSQDPNEYDARSGMTVLHGVLVDRSRWHFGNVRRLCEAYSDQEQRTMNFDLLTLTDHKETALHQASRLSAMTIFIYLLRSCHANPAVRDGEGNNAFVIPLAVPPKGARATIQWLETVVTIYIELIRPRVSHRDELLTSVNSSSSVISSSSTASAPSSSSSSPFCQSEFESRRKVEHDSLDAKETADIANGVSEAEWTARAQLEYVQFKKTFEETMQVDLKTQVLSPSLLMYQRNLALALNDIIEQRCDHPSQRYPMNRFNSVYRPLQTSPYPSRGGTDVHVTRAVHWLDSDAKYREPSQQVRFNSIGECIDRRIVNLTAHFDRPPPPEPQQPPAVTLSYDEQEFDGLRQFNPALKALIAKFGNFHMNVRRILTPPLVEAVQEFVITDLARIVAEFVVG